MITVDFLPFHAREIDRDHEGAEFGATWTLGAEPGWLRSWG